MSQSYGVIGYPLGHTLSPFIHRALFALSGKKADYGAWEIPPEALAGQMPFLSSLDGFNITIPHKERIIPLLDRLSDRARRYGAVNTVRREPDGTLTGDNTDCVGFLSALDEEKRALSGRVAVLGAGGASRMMAFEAALAGGEVVVAVRESGLARAQALRDEIAEKTGRNISVTTLGELNGSFDLLCNGTPVGMTPHPDACPVGAEVIARAAVVFDAVYNPGETVLLRRARAAGCVCVGGMAMLVGQAAAAQTFWLGDTFTAAQCEGIVRDAQAELARRFPAGKIAD